MRFTRDAGKQARRPRARQAGYRLVDGTSMVAFGGVSAFDPQTLRAKKDEQRWEEKLKRVAKRANANVKNDPGTEREGS